MIKAPLERKGLNGGLAYSFIGLIQDHHAGKRAGIVLQQ